MKSWSDDESAEPRGALLGIYFASREVPRGQKRQLELTDLIGGLQPGSRLLEADGI